MNTHFSFRKNQIIGFFPAFICILFFTPLLVGQVIPSNNRVDWSIAGHEGNLPNSAISINAKTDYNAQGNGTTDDGPAIQNALDAASAGDVVYLPAGIYFIQNTLSMPDGVVLRGDCSGGTILRFDLGGQIEACIEILTYQYGSFVPVSAGLSKGSTVITVSDASGFTLGSFAEIRQENDPAKMYTSSTWNQSWAQNAVGQMAKVMAINGNQITIYPALTIDFDPAMDPEVRPTGLIENVGIEDLAIERIDNGDHYTIDITNAYNCWIRNVESYTTMKSHIWTSKCLFLEFRNNYFSYAHDYGGGGHGYGIVLGRHTTYCLVENNIFKHLRHSTMLKEGATGNVFGYNYSILPYWGPSSVTPTDGSLHGHYPNMNLYEGNVMQHITSADYWGPSGPGNTFFRNRIELDDLIMNDASHSHNLVGNELTSGSNVVDIHPSVNNTLEHGNNENGTITWDGGLSQSLSNSYYLSSTPSYWNGQSWPNIGPEFTIGSGTVPAQDRYNSVSTNTCNFLLDPTHASALPLELVDFTGIWQDKGAYLQWEFMKVPNLEGTITLQHSPNGQDFKRIYSTSYEEVEASFQHTKDLASLNFYRLQQEDLDGSITYSPVVVVKMPIENAPIRIYPNPATKIIYIQVPSNNSSFSGQLLDASGRVLRTFEGNANDTFHLFLEDLPFGNYWLDIKTEEQSWLEKITLIE